MTLSQPTRELIFNCPFIPVWAYGSKAQSFFSFFFSRSSFHTSKIVFWVKFSIASEVLESKAHMESSWIIGRWELRMFKRSSRTGWSVLSRYAGKYISFLCLGQDHVHLYMESWRHNVATHMSALLGPKGRRTQRWTSCCFFVSARGCWGLNPGSLEKQEAFSTSEPLSSPRVTFLSIYRKILLKNHNHVQK